MASPSPKGSCTPGFSFTVHPPLAWPHTRPFPSKRRAIGWSKCHFFFPPLDDIWKTDVSSDWEDFTSMSVSRITKGIWLKAQRGGKTGKIRKNPLHLGVDLNKSTDAGLITARRLLTGNPHGAFSWMQDPPRTL